MKWPRLLYGGRRASGDRTQSSMGFSMHGKQSHASARAHAVVVRVPPLAADALCVVSARISRFRPGRLVIIHGPRVHGRSKVSPRPAVSHRAIDWPRDISSLAREQDFTHAQHSHTYTTFTPTCIRSTFQSSIA